MYACNYVCNVCMAGSRGVINRSNWRSGLDDGIVLAGFLSPY